MRIEVEPGGLGAEGASQAQLAGHIRELAGKLASASSAACATGDPELSGAIESYLAGCSESLTVLANSVAGIGANLGSASSAYAGTDQAAIPSLQPIQSLKP